jgi:hypothetical protein
MRRRLLAILLAPAAVVAAPRLFYSKSFPGSVPEYVEILVERDGKVEFREDAKDEAPIRFTLLEADVNEFFALAEKLGKFQRPLESGLPVARMGQKTFRWEDGATKHSVEFNYSQDLDAQALLDRFEKITETVGHRIQLERAVRYDRLGIHKVLLQIQVTIEKNRLSGGEILLPYLDRIRNNDSFLNMARERASALAEWIRNGKPKAE